MLSALRSWLAPPVATAEGEAALDPHLDEPVRFHGQAARSCSTACTSCFGRPRATLVRCDLAYVWL